MLKDSQHKLFIDFEDMGIACVCLTNDGEILVGIVYSKANFLGIARYSIDGERKQLLTHMMENWTPKPLLSGTYFRVYIDKNVNGDICLSGDTDLSQVVNVISQNGNYRFTYKGKEASIRLIRFYLGGYVPMSLVRFSLQMKTTMESMSWIRTVVFLPC